MWLTWNQMVVTFVLASLPTGGRSVGSAGTDFITAFMENVAYFYPGVPVHKLLLSALRDGTQVNVTVGERAFETSYRMNTGQTQEVSLPPWVELNKFKSSNKTVRVSSNLPVTVLSVSRKTRSMDTSVVQPLQNLGKQYHVPSPPAPTDRFYQFIVINTEDANTVTVSQSPRKPTEVTLGPYDTAQFRSALYPESTEVTAKKPVAVLFGHPCSEAEGCSCSLAFEQLAPVSHWGTAFMVPALSVSSTVNQSLLLVASDGTDPESLLPSGAVTEVVTAAPASVSLLRPGLITLIPEEHFSACYLLHTFQGFQNFALVVVKTADREGVQLRDQPLPSVSWTAVDTTHYSVGLVTLGSASSHLLIWHLTSKMAVYMFAGDSEISFGSPALSLKVEPDGSRCRVYHGEVTLVQEQKSWTEAAAHCEAVGSRLASFNSDALLQEVGQELRGAGPSAAWLGLRRSLMSAEWRWLSRERLAVSYWGKGEPNGSLITQCAMMSLEPASMLTWSTAKCCDKWPFICFLPGTDFPFP
ncbi:hypothetical protein AAFF_G00307930 [Aldrovandia affinis]|uniref:C-type lectin domain-containing protein n=1 Tax=Aldrovandia affinis TaxID=143900 RepID=A0AAD7R8C3_9TELE|nr:hypothetical protein AAFF_G00307930 [Aldrovandia affinis]